MIFLLQCSAPALESMHCLICDMYYDFCSLFSFTFLFDYAISPRRKGKGSCKRKRRHSREEEEGSGAGSLVEEQLSLAQVQ